MKSIALFNNKGGVSKTTTAFNLGWMLAEKGQRVLLVDADPQCNLTGMVMGFDSHEDLERFYEENPTRNLKGAVRAAFESRPEPLRPVEPLAVAEREGLFLLPGHVGLSEYEVQLGLSQELTGSIQALQNLPGALRHLYTITAESVDADYVLIDMSPGLGAINQNLVATCDYILIPTSPDIFSVMAIDSISRVLPRWLDWASRAAQMTVFQDASYPLSTPRMKFLGVIVQRYRLKYGLPTRAFRDYFRDIETAIDERLAPSLAKVDALLPEAFYRDNTDEGSNYRISSISDFNALIASSQQAHKPVFMLTQADVGRGGAAWDVTEENIAAFRETFEVLAQRVVSLTDDEQSE
ncbi:MAG: AAA family ATPase [Cellulomonadaceae bacterium]|nr:AAA family ATPase [Cellulomonadaceae bacterium]